MTLEKNVSILTRGYRQALIKPTMLENKKLSLLLKLSAQRKLQHVMLTESKTVETNMTIKISPVLLNFTAPSSIFIYKIFWADHKILKIHILNPIKNHALSVCMYKQASM